MDDRKENELRRFARLQVSASAFISHQGRLYSGLIEDMSTHALNVAIDSKIPVGSKVEVTLVTLGGQKLAMIGEVLRSFDGSLVIGEARGREVLRNFFFQMA